MKETNIILTPITQANGKLKNWPAVILREIQKFRDFLVCGVSTQLKQCIPNFDEIIYTGDSNFMFSRLVSDSVIRF